MKRYGNLLLIFALSVLAGCAAYEPGPLTKNHPAHPEATAAPERAFSRTLAYAASDMPSPHPVSAAAPSPQGGKESGAGAQQTVVGEGKVIATVPSASQIVVEHGEIKGFMGAMAMGYRTEPPSLLEGLKSGDKVRFTIDVQKNAIVKIEKAGE